MQVNANNKCGSYTHHVTEGSQRRREERYEKKLFLIIIYLIVIHKTPALLLYIVQLVLAILIKISESKHSYLKAKCGSKGVRIYIALLKATTLFHDILLLHYWVIPGKEAFGWRRNWRCNLFHLWIQITAQPSKHTHSFYREFILFY